jgi:hypothetical protein
MNALTPIVPQRGHEERDHSPWGASAAARYTKCYGSVYMLQKFPQPTSAAAKEGTWAHECLEKALLNVPFDEINFKDKEMRDGVKEAYDWVDTILAANPGAILFLEKPFKVSEDVWGTNDVAIYVPSTQTLYVMDFKYGKAIVDVRGNKQLRVYGLGAIMELFAVGLLVRRIEVTICQPRVDHPDGTARPEEVDLVDLYDFSLELDEAVEKTKDAALLLDVLPTLPQKMQDDFWESGKWRKIFAPSADTCHFCCKAVCPAAQREALDSLPEVYDLDDLPTFTPPAPAGIDVARLVAIVKSKKMIEKWLDACWVQLLLVGLQGADLGELKIVRTQSKRAFLSDEEIVLAGLEEISEHGIDRSSFLSSKLKGIGDTENILMGLPEEILVKFGKNKTERLRNIKTAMAELMEKREGQNYTIADLNDSREAVVNDALAEIDFSAIADLDEGDE